MPLHHTPSHSLTISGQMGMEMEIEISPKLDRQIIGTGWAERNLQGLQVHNFVCAVAKGYSIRNSRCRSQLPGSRQDRGLEPAVEGRKG